MIVHFSAQVQNISRNVCSWNASSTHIKLNDVIQCCVSWCTGTNRLQNISCLQLYLYLDRPCTFYLWDSTKRILFLYDTTVSTDPYIKKNVGTSRFPSSRLVIRTNLPISQFILHQMFYFLCMICLPVFRLLFRLFVFVVTRENVFSQLYIHRMKPGLSLYLCVFLCYDRCWTKNRPFW